MSLAIITSVKIVNSGIIHRPKQKEAIMSPLRLNKRFKSFYSYI